MASWNGKSLSGCIFEERTLSAPVMRFAAAGRTHGDASLPDKVDLRPKCTSVEDQGQTNSCTANAVVGAMEFHLAKRDGRATDLSRMFVYFNTRRLNGTITQDGGARISEAMAAALAYGACREDLWPFDVSRMAEQPPQPCYLDGLGNEAMQYARVPGLEGAVHALAQGLPVVFGCFLPQRLYDEAAQTGRMPASRPDERQSPPSFGHAMLVVGYDLPAKELIVRNSWGPGWGEKGYCRLPFQEAAMFSPPDAFWVLASLEPNQNFSVTGPASAAASGAPAKVLSDASPSAVFGRTPASTAPASAAGSVKSEVERMKAQLRGEMSAQRQSLSEKIGALRGQTGAPSAPPAGAAGDLGYDPNKRCSMCQGTGNCYQCNGTGANMGYPCSACGFNGRCGVCGGNGRG